MNVVIRHGLLQVLLHIVLDGLVNGGDHIEAVLAGVVFLKLGKEQLRPHGVGGSDGSAGAAGKGLIILGFDPFQAVVIRTNEADQVTGQRGIGVVALGVRFQADAPQAILVLEDPDFVCLVLFQLPGHGHIPAALLPGFFIDLVIADIQDLR